jgi:hypothetical protein
VVEICQSRDDPLNVYIGEKLRWTAGVSSPPISLAIRVGIVRDLVIN